MYMSSLILGDRINIPARRLVFPLWFIITNLSVNTHATRTLSSPRSAKLATRISDFDHLTASPGQMDHLISLCPTRQGRGTIAHLLFAYSVSSRARARDAISGREISIYRYTHGAQAWRPTKAEFIFCNCPASLYLLENNLSSFTGV